MGGAQEFISCVDKQKFCMRKLNVRIQWERNDANVEKLQALVQENAKERNRMRGQEQFDYLK